MQRRLLKIFVYCLVASVMCTNCSAEGNIFGRLVPRKKIEADPAGDYRLTDQQGPWLIMAMYFSGEDGEAKARELVVDLRQNYNLPAYHWGMSFQLNDSSPGRGIDHYGGKIRRRYRRGGQVTQHAVLIGDFPALGDPEAQKSLEAVKSMIPATLQADNQGPTAESLTNVSKFRNYLLSSNGKSNRVGPMNHAFVTRNPLLPKEYFAPTGVDEQVAKWNTGLEYSLLDCERNFTIKVATFKGRTSLKSANEELGDLRTRKAEEDDPLVIAVQNAHLLTMALREKGWEAYEFHDRYQSYVAIGSFENAQQTADGKFLIDHRDAQIIIDTFGASKPNNIFNRPAQQDLQLEHQRKQQFSTLLGTGGQVASGFYPKKFIGLPFDIYPESIRVPKRSISSAYARN